MVLINISKLLKGYILPKFKLGCNDDLNEVIEARYVGHTIITDD